MVTTTDERAHLVRRATYASVTVACLLIVLKVIAWRATDSVSLLSTLLDSCFDAGASLLNMIAVRQAWRPPTENYRFGHGKMEALAALGQAFFIIASSLFLLGEALDHFRHPSPVIPSATALGVGVMVVSILLTMGLVRFQRYVVRQTQSLAVSADSLHYFGDILINGGVIISLVSAWGFGWLWVDPVFGCGVACYIFFNAIQITITPLGVLMDKELAPKYRQQIEDIVRHHPGAQGFHELKTRSSGTHIFIQLHLELERTLSLAEAHVIADGLESKLRLAFPHAEVIIHQDPV